MKHYLGLDQSPRKIGWAVGSADMISPMSGVYELPSAGSEFGITLALVRDWLSDKLTTFRITDVCFETPFSGPFTNRKAIRQMYSLADFIEFVCVDHNVRCREATSHAWRRHFIGYAQAPKTIVKKERRAWLKEQAIRACTYRHWYVSSDDEADACGLMSWAISCDHPTYAIKDTPLFTPLDGE